VKSGVQDPDVSISMDIQRWMAAGEGQFFERKSTWDLSGQRPRLRKARDIAYEIAETVSAMANADGGELVVGMEDDGSISGLGLPQDKIKLLLEYPVTATMSLRLSHVVLGNLSTRGPAFSTLTWTGARTFTNWQTAAICCACMTGTRLSPPTKLLRSSPRRGKAFWSGPSRPAPV